MAAADVEVRHWTKQDDMAFIGGCRRCAAEMIPYGNDGKCIIKAKPLDSLRVKQKFPRHRFVMGTASKNTHQRH